jgi:hypothetical protein
MFNSNTMKLVSGSAVAPFARRLSLGPAAGPVVCLIALGLVRYAGACFAPSGMRLWGWIFLSDRRFRREEGDCAMIDPDDICRDPGIPEGSSAMLIIVTVMAGLFFWATLCLIGWIVALALA